MERLIFLLISIVLTGIFIYAIPLGFSRKEKNLIVLTSSLLGSFGLISVLTADFWKVMVLIVLLGTCAGYIIGNRTASPNVQVPLIDRLHDRNEEALLKIGPVKKELEEHIELQPLDHLSVLNPVSHDDEPLIQIEDDISFLEERNKVHIPSIEWEQPVTSINGSDFHDENWMKESEAEKLYASTNS